MKIIQGIQNIKESITYPVLTIGNFDGVHLGHQTIFKKVVDRVKEVEGTGIVFTFEPHPKKILFPDKYIASLTTFEKKLELIEKTGIDIVICADFTPDFAALSPREFTKSILVEKICVKEVFVGHDFNFGKKREGTFGNIQKMGEEFGFKVEVLDAVKINGGIVSSSFIRDLIADGQVSKAARYLGRPYSLAGKVIGGCEVGSSMGFPTANIEIRDKLIPHTGVYAVQIVVQKKTFNGVANIGYNPTFKRNVLSIEVHIFDFTENLYDQTIRLSFIDKIRDEIAFSSREELKIQIQKDIKTAKEIIDGEID
ncbi:MAG TPA: bifunctional riboflavin kinase/FAD synthetase [Nitrospinota bacterium]|jgi:riboflavin kinase/FMN adenylyltransferase|nr:bifunctional riboflavin kinase/FAD synthetase [Nitrospinota bacterium]